MRAMIVATCSALALALALAAVAEAETPRTDNRARAEVVVVKGDGALARGDFEQAEKAFRVAIGMVPELPSAQLGLGAALVGRTRYAEAIEVLDQAEQLYRELDEAHRVAMLKIHGVIDDARRQVSVLEDDHSVGHMIPNWQGLENDQVSKLNATQGPPVPAQVYYLQGIARVRLGDRDAGVERLRRCLEVDPHHALAHYNLGVALLGVGDREMAEHHIQRAVQAGLVVPPALLDRLVPPERRLASVE